MLYHLQISLKVLAVTPKEPLAHPTALELLAPIISYDYYYRC